jgi:hypothetical protein
MKTASLAPEDSEMMKSHALRGGRGDEAKDEAGPPVETVTEDMETEAGGTEAQGTSQDLRYPLCSNNLVKHLIVL